MPKRYNLEIFDKGMKIQMIENIKLSDGRALKGDKILANIPVWHIL